MDGVTILNSYEVYATYKSKAVLKVIFGILAILFALTGIAFLVLICLVGLDLPPSYILGCIALSGACIVGWTYHATASTEVLVGMIYEVSVSDDVKFDEFMDRYNILNQRGKIYIVTDKIPEDENDIK